jgi:hypothetical protein
MYRIRHYRYRLVKIKLANAIAFLEKNKGFEVFVQGDNELYHYYYKFEKVASPLFLSIDKTYAYIQN